ncbi:AMP-binding protein [Streptosporangium amethystogenes]|uniref:AMP-binding protein n=1 Tax=Streptosporangium amethystogenes TaxID=2002 RepID=UPI0037B0CCAB
MSAQAGGEVLRADGGDLPSLRHLSYGGGRMPRPIIEQTLRLLPEVDFVNGYGLTETTSSIAVLSPQDHRDAVTSTDPRVSRRLDSVGRPPPAVEIVVRDSDGAPVPAGSPGELWVRGPQVSGEYAHASQTEEGGWFRTLDATVVTAADDALPTPLRHLQPVLAPRDHDVEAAWAGGAATTR